MKKYIILTALLLSGSWASAQVLLPDVAPAASGKHIVIQLAMQRMFVYQEGKIKNIYPIAVGKARTKTPAGEYTIGPVAYKPTWNIPKSIQKERGAAGKPAITSIPPGPNNPLGPVFIRLGDPRLSLGIHGTNAPSSVPGVRSHGCVRMKSSDALTMAKFVNRGMPASVIYQLVGLNQDEKGQLWLAAYSDPYGNKNLDRQKLNASLKLWEKQHGVALNQARIEQTLKAKKSQAVCISCTAATGNKVSGALKSLAWTEGLLTRAKPAVVPGTASEPEPKSASFPWFDEEDSTGGAIEVNI